MAPRVFSSILRAASITRLLPFPVNGINERISWFVPEFAADFLVVLLGLELGLEPLDVLAAHLQLLFEMRELARGRFAQLAQRRLQFLHVVDQCLHLRKERKKKNKA